MFFLNQGNIPKLSLPEDTNIMLLEVGLTVPEEKSVQEKTKSFKVFSKRMTINWAEGRGGEGSYEYHNVKRLKFIWRGSEWCSFCSWVSETLLLQGHSLSRVARITE